MSTNYLFTVAGVLHFTYCSDLRKIYVLYLKTGQTKKSVNLQVETFLKSRVQCTLKSFIRLLLNLVAKVPDFFWIQFGNSVYGGMLWTDLQGRETSTP